MSNKSASVLAIQINSTHLRIYIIYICIYPDMYGLGNEIHFFVARESTVNTTIIYLISIGCNVITPTFSYDVYILKP